MKTNTGFRTIITSKTFCKLAFELLQELLIFSERPNYQTFLSVFYMIFRLLEVGVRKKKEKKKERKKKMDVRCQNISSRV